MTQPSNTLYLIDGHGFIFRAYHALPPLTRPDGTPVGAVMGFCNILLRILEEAGTANIAVVFDSSGTNFRHDIYPEYKANRSEPPEDLVPQFSLVRDATDAFGIAKIVEVGFEADDLIATYAREAAERGMDVRIVSSDKDLMQLVNDRIALMDPIKFTTISYEQVMDKFGVTPDKVIDVQALAGDSIDNIPGVPGIGVKTAAQLLEIYGDLETLLARADEIKQPKRRENLVNYREMALISKKLVALEAHAPMPIPFEDLKPHTPDLDALLPFLKEQGFRSLINRIEKRWGIDASSLEEDTETVSSNTDAAEKADTPVMRHYALVNTMDALQTWIDRAAQQGFLAIDTETDNLTPAQANLVGISMAVAPGEACYIPVGHKQETSLFAEDSAETIAQLPIKDVIQAFKPLLENDAVLKIGQNIKYDLQIFAAHGINVSPIADTMVMSYTLDGGKHGHGLDELAQLYCGETLIAYKDVAGTGKNKKTLDQLSPQAVRDYASEDADICLRLYHILQPRLIAEKHVALYQDIDIPLAALLARMEYTGITVDSSVLLNLSHDFLDRMEKAEKRVFDHVGHDFNLASPKQMGEVLFEELGLQGGKKTKTGAYSTDAKTLETLSLQGHAVVDDILEWRQLAKLRSTYTEALQQQINPRTGRVHTSFNAAVTNTGRLSSTDPNLQNIPIRTEEGKLIRTAFVPKDGCVLLSADYSQIELRLVAEMAQIKRLQQAFHDRVDIHALTASEVFGIPLSEMTSDKRRAAKAINFGIIYGISGYGLAKQLATDPGTANAYIRQYMERFPELRDYMEDTKAFAKKHGYVVTLLGRKCHMPGITSKNGAERAFAERQAINAPIQGTAADIMKIAMLRVDQALRAQNLPASILLQVHDELVLEVTKDAVETVGNAVQKAMETAYDMNVPLTVEWGSGANWGEAH